jgi:guanylate kinase
MESYWSVKNLVIKMPGKLFLIVGPSGVGKGTLVDLLRKKHRSFYFPPSATTRPPRRGERDGKQYYFFTDARFEKLKKAGGFLETAVVHELCKYGTLKKPILEAIKKGKTVIREVDIQGLISIRKKLKKDLFAAIFISPPSLKILKSRILHRQPDMTSAELAHRMQSVKKELAGKHLADYEVVSEEDKLAKLVREVEGIINDQLKRS